MDPLLKDVYKHMQQLGMGALTHANYHAHLSSPGNALWAEMSVLQAAHAAEIFIKARIAQEHPLLIFEDLPKSTKLGGRKLDLQALIENGATYQYKDLPDRLWATTGISLPNVELYREFGYLRNTIQHFAPPENTNFGQKTLEFVFGVIDPFINQSWDAFAIDYNEDDPPYQYLLESLLRHEITFLVSEGVLDEWPTDSDWTDNQEYRAEMERRFEAAKAKFRPEKKPS